MRRAGLASIGSALGIWPNRDPIGEEGGLNLQAMVDNGGVNWIDPLGLKSLQVSIRGRQSIPITLMDESRYMHEFDFHYYVHITCVSPSQARVDKYYPSGELEAPHGFKEYDESVKIPFSTSWVFSVLPERIRKYRRYAPSIGGTVHGARRALVTSYTAVSSNGKGTVTFDIAASAALNVRASATIPMPIAWLLGIDPEIWSGTNARGGVVHFSQSAEFDCCSAK